MGVGRGKPVICPIPMDILETIKIENEIKYAKYQ
jgi:hypothetical protein